MSKKFKFTKGSPAAASKPAEIKTKSGLNYNFTKVKLNIL